MILLTCGQLKAKETKEHEKWLTDTENTQMIAKGEESRDGEIVKGIYEYKSPVIK